MGRQPGPEHRALGGHASAPSGRERGGRAVPRNEREGPDAGGVEDEGDVRGALLLHPRHDRVLPEPPARVGARRGRAPGGGGGARGRRRPLPGLQPQPGEDPAGAARRLGRVPHRRAGLHRRRAGGPPHEVLRGPRRGHQAVAGADAPGLPEPLRAVQAGGDARLRGVVPGGGEAARADTAGPVPHRHHRVVAAGAEPLRGEGLPGDAGVRGHVHGGEQQQPAHEVRLPVGRRALRPGRDDPARGHHEPGLGVEGGALRAAAGAEAAQHRLGPLHGGLRADHAQLRAAALIQAHGPGERLRGAALVRDPRPGRQPEAPQRRGIRAGERGPLALPLTTARAGLACSAPGPAAPTSGSARHARAARGPGPEPYPRRDILRRGRSMHSILRRHACVRGWRDTTCRGVSPRSAAIPPEHSRASLGLRRSGRRSPSASAASCPMQPLRDQDGGRARGGGVAGGVLRLECGRGRSSNASPSSYRGQ
mmetsp:Transcript_127178/g.359946  ORF Transcript_127178/g.359946 Transcript_127178/m.359946 type:complete len:480 (-) Transcript_127178:8-1447(-)